MMNNETYIDFCFIRQEEGSFSTEIDSLLKEVFGGKRLSWYLEEKNSDGANMVVAEIKGMSDLRSEEETIQYLEETAGDRFWDYLQGYKIFIYPASRGCNSCGTH